MLSTFVAHVTHDDLDREAATYSDLVSLASNYARKRLEGVTVVNRPTQLAIELSADGLKTATHDGPSFEVRLVVHENFRGQCFFDRMLEKRTPTPRRDAGGEVPDDTAVDQTTEPDSPILANAEGEPGFTEPGGGSDDECWRRCGHLLPSPSGGRQASEFRRCWRLCKGSLHE